MSDYDMLLAAIDDWPQWRERRLLLADACEDEGRMEEAEFWRWTYKHRFRVYAPNPTWFNDAQYSVKQPGYDTADVPEEVWKNLTAGEVKDNRWRSYPTTTEAYFDLFAAWLTWR